MQPDPALPLLRVLVLRNLKRVELVICLRERATHPFYCSKELGLAVQNRRDVGVCAAPGFCRIRNALGAPHAAA